MALFILILLLLAAMAGVLGAVLKATLVIVLSLVLTVVLLAWIGAWYAKRRMREFQRDFQLRGDQSRRRGEAYDIGDQPPPAPPAGELGGAREKRAAPLPPGPGATRLAREVLQTLEEMGDPSRLERMTRYGIRTDHAVGVTVTELRHLARGLRPDHELAAALWASGIHEARILASLVDEPARVSQAQMDAWVADLDSWDVCDGVCGNLVDPTPSALDTAAAWITR